MNSLISNDKISLRALEPSDVELLYSWENDTALWTVSNTIAPYSRETLRTYIENSANDIYSNRQLRLIIMQNATGKPIGTVDFMEFNPIDNRAELGLFIIPECQGMGLGSETMKVVNQYAAEGIGLRQLFVYVPEDNATCLSVIRHSGFQEVGILQNWIRRRRQYHNVVLLQHLY